MISQLFFIQNKNVVQNDLIDEKLIGKSWERQSRIFKKREYESKTWTLDFSKSIISDFDREAKKKNIDLNKEAIKDLIIDNNDLTSIDVSANIFLELFFCQRNDLTSLDLSGNYFLQKIWCL